MGLLRSLVLLPLAPVEGVLWLARNIQEVAEREMDSPQAYREWLADAEAAHRRGEISAEELAQVEEAVVARLFAAPDGQGAVTDVATR